MEKTRFTLKGDQQKEFDIMVGQISDIGQISPSLIQQSVKQAIVKYEQDTRTTFSSIRQLDLETRLNEIQKVADYVGESLQPYFESRNTFWKAMLQVQFGLEKLI